MRSDARLRRRREPGDNEAIKQARLLASRRRGGPRQTSIRHRRVASLRAYVGDLGSLIHGVLSEKGTIYQNNTTCRQNTVYTTDRNDLRSPEGFNERVPDRNPSRRPSGSAESQIFGRIAESSEASRARGFLRENRRFSRDSPAATQFEGKKHCASFVGSSGTCSRLASPRQQLINRSALSPETPGETHRAASLSL